MSKAGSAGGAAGTIVKLPAADFIGALKVEQALRLRRSIREYGKAPLTLKDLSQLLWAAQGVTGAAGLRTAPSAGELYPLSAYVVVGHVKGLDMGVYRYQSVGHSLELVQAGDLRAQLSGISLDQEWIKTAPATIVIAAEYGRTTQVYGERGRRYVIFEAGHAAQNVHLQAVSMELGTVFIGAFDDKAVQALLQLPEPQNPIAMLPVGYLL